MQLRATYPFALVLVSIVACQDKPSSPTIAASASTAASTSAPRLSASATAAQVLALKKEASAFVDQYELDKARAKMLAAQQLAPDDRDLKEGLVELDKTNANRVAGRWFNNSNKDPMTDKVNAVMTLPATNDIATTYSTTRPTLIARCIKGEPDVVVQFDAVVESDISNNAKARYRFDSDPAESITMTAGEGHKGLFFKEPKKWFDRLLAHPSGKLIVEIPLYAHLPEAATFDLTGADKAIPPVKACAK